jgi:hypothetical protein
MLNGMSLRKQRGVIQWRLLRGGKGASTSSVNFIQIKIVCETLKKSSFLDKTILNIFMSPNNGLKHTV